MQEVNTSEVLTANFAANLEELTQPLVSAEKEESIQQAMLGDLYDEQVDHHLTVLSVVGLLINAPTAIGFAIGGCRDRGYRALGFFAAAFIVGLFTVNFLAPFIGSDAPFTNPTGEATSFTVKSGFLAAFTCVGLMFSGLRIRRGLSDNKKNTGRSTLLFAATLAVTSIGPIEKFMGDTANFYLAYTLDAGSEEI